MEIEKIDALWNNDGPGTSMAALTDAKSGLMRHVATRVDIEDGTKVEFVVECADGAVNAFITFQLGYYFENRQNISEILVKIVAAHVGSS
jgi:carboxypeptidase C (cathepsin A)